MNDERFIFELFINRKLSPIVGLPPRLSADDNGIELFPSSTKQLQTPLLIRDIPDYLDCEIKNSKGFKTRIIKQYPGFSVSLAGSSNTKEYLSRQLSKRNRKNLFSKLRKLEREGEISYQFYYGSIDHGHFKTVLLEMHSMLKKRFLQKKTYNRYLKDWKQLMESLHQKILRKEASICVIYDHDKPIAVTLNYHLKDLVLSHIQTYDLDYAKYNLGDILMLKHLDWSFDNQIAFYDLSIGETPFKLKWCNCQYRFNHALFYNNQSLNERITAEIKIISLKTKQYLRDKNIIGGRIQADKLFYKRRMLKLSDPVKN
jgi:hypothetical protein